MKRKSKTKSLIPKSAEKLPHRVLREGEHTGHAHRAVAEDVTLHMDGDRLFMKSSSGTEIVHEEHRSIFVPGGERGIGAVREYDHFAEEARDVMD